jgi:hypothetical protein
MTDTIVAATDHPTTFRGEPAPADAIRWNDHASVHLASDGQGVFDPLKGLYRGSLAEMVALVSHMPADERDKFVIQKAGGHRLSSAEIMSLAARPDFPLRD